MKLEKMIPRVRGISQETFFSEFVLNQQPVVIEDSVEDWSALTEWTPDYLKSKIGGLKVGLKKSDTHKHPDVYQKNPGEVLQMSFSDYLDHTVFSKDLTERMKYYVSGDENVFFADGENQKSLEALRSDFSLPDFFPHDALQQISFWISVKGLFSWLHFDGNCFHNLNVQVSGSKRVMLFDPNLAKKLYPFSLRETAQGFNFSKIDLTDIDDDRFPEFKDCAYQETVLEKGDMLFIPSTWYHGIEHLGEVNMNVNFWWKPTQYDLNPMLLRSQMLEMFDKAYLREHVMAEENPKVG